MRRIRLLVLVFKLAFLVGVAIAVLTVPRWMAEVDVSHVMQVMQNGMAWLIDQVDDLQW